MAFFDDELIIVGQLIAMLDIAPRIDEHAAPLFHRLAIWITAVINPSCRIATTISVDDRTVIQQEQKSMRPLFVTVFTIGGFAAHSFSLIFDNARPFRYTGSRINTFAMDARITNDYAAGSGVAWS